VAKETAQLLVGRDRELEVLASLLAQAREGAPRFAQVTGEAGIGKTYLLSELARRADEDGWLVLTGRSSELEREYPFGLVIDAFDAYLASMDPRAFDRVAADELGELAGLFPSLRSLVPEPEYPTTPPERFRAHKAVVEMMERLAAQQPVLLLLDDLHWADGASIEQAGYVLRRPPQAPVMIVGSFRTGQADPALMKAVELAARAGAVEFIELGPLEPGDAGRLVGEGPERDRLYHLSGGNPFYLLQLARGGSRGGPAPDGGVEGVPAAVSTAISGELERLSPASRGMADAAAVVGDPFELDLAAQTAELSDADALAAVDELIACDVIRPTDVPRVFQFRHPLMRSAIYEGCAPGTRLALHQRASKSLADRGAPPAERAHHVEHAARRGDEEAVRVLREAGEGAAGRAPTSAVRWFDAALRLLPDSAPAADRLGLLIPLAGARAATGKLEESRAALLQAIELATDDGAVPRLRVLAACAAVEQLLGRHAEAHRRLLDALESVPDPGSADAASVMIDLAVDAFFGMRYDEMRDWSIRAAEVARPLGDAPLLATAVALAAFSASCAGPVPEAQAACTEAAALVEALSDEELGTRLDAVTWLSAAEFYLERYEAGIPHAERGLRLARATGQGDLVPGLTQALGNLLFVSGRPLEAGVILDGAVDSARLTDNAVALAWSLLNRSYCALNEGDVATAYATGEEAYDVTRDLEDSVVGAWAGTSLAGALIEMDEPGRAAEILIERTGGEDAPLIPGAWRATCLEWLVRCWVALGRLDDAERIAELSRARAEEFPTPVARELGERATADIALASGDPALAAECALRSADLAAESKARIESALSRTLAGRALAEAGDTDRAAAELERAAAEFDACGSLRYRDRAERELGKLGRRVHRRSRPGSQDGSGVESLTGRELEVAELVVDRRTNPEIAAELFLSVKTVETHMRNIFRKLDVSSRVEVARAVEGARAGGGG
jgi:DNA-binding NarL/FixJ family response regulator